MTTISPETASKIAVWRAKSADGTLTIEELREAIKIMRQDRISAAHASATSRQAKAKTVIPAAADLLSAMKGL